MNPDGTLAIMLSQATRTLGCLVAGADCVPDLARFRQVLVASPKVPGVVAGLIATYSGARNGTFRASFDLPNDSHAITISIEVLHPEDIASIPETPFSAAGGSDK
jgi:hypothetical protein